MEFDNFLNELEDLGFELYLLSTRDDSVESRLYRKGQFTVEIYRITVVVGIKSADKEGNYFKINHYFTINRPEQKVELQNLPAILDRLEKAAQVISA